MSLTFVAFDFETANAHRGSPCSIGLTEFENEQVVARHYRLMRPPKGLDHFDGVNMSIHGISPSMVADQPRFADLWPEIEEIIGERVLVAHNAAFDISVLTQAASASGLRWPSLSYACTMVQARRTYDLLSYTLPNVALAAGVELTEHHDAGADALATGQILLAIARQHGVDSFEALGHATRTRLGFLREGAWRGNQPITASGSTATSKLAIPGTNPDANPTNPLYGKRIVFTGPLGSMTRQAAVEMCAELGAEPQPGVRKDTNLLVVGVGTGTTSKHAKAMALKAKGHTIEIMESEDFLDIAYEALNATSADNDA